MDNVDGKTAFWKGFREVVYSDSEKGTGFVSCIEYKILMVHTVNKGNSHINRHKCLLVLKDPNSSMLSFVMKKSKYLPKSAVNEFKEKFIQFIGQDIRPMDIVSG